MLLCGTINKEWFGVRKIRSRFSGFETFPSALKTTSIRNVDDDSMARMLGTLFVFFRARFVCVNNVWHAVRLVQQSIVALFYLIGNNMNANDDYFEVLYAFTGTYMNIITKSTAILAHR